MIHLFGHLHSVFVETRMLLKSAIWFYCDLRKLELAYSGYQLNFLAKVDSPVQCPGCLSGLAGSVLNYRSQLPEFESQRGHM